MPPLVVENVVKQFGPVRALASISLEVAQGEFLAIMGASGSGKSTLLHLMAGLARPDAGIVRVDGIDLANMGDRQCTLFRRRKIGLVFQAFNLIPNLSARENIGLPLMLDGSNGDELQSRVDDLLKKLGIWDRREHRPDSLSGGEQQRVAIARALVAEPAVILADEPTGNLDSASSKSVCELLRDLSVNENRTIVMVTHEPTVAAYAGQVAILRDGQIVQQFATENMNGTDLAARYQRAVG